MRYVRLGTVNSRDEEAAVEDAYIADRISGDRLVEYVRHLQALDDHGFESVQSAWIKTSEERLVVFVGRPEKLRLVNSDGDRILAAVELDNDDRVGALIKIVSDYNGDPREFSDHITDAIQRFRKGERFDDE